MIRVKRWIALILIAEGDQRINEFYNFGASSHWARTYHPAYIANKIPVGLEDFVLVHYHHLPCILVNTMVHSNIVPHLTDEERRQEGRYRLDSQK